MVWCRSFVVQNVHWPVISGHDGIEPAVVIKVANRHSTCDPSLTENAAGSGGNIYKPVTGIVGKQHGFPVVKIGIIQFDGIEIMSLSNEKILPAVVIVVEKMDPPAGVRQAHLSNSQELAGISE